MQAPDAHPHQPQPIWCTHASHERWYGLQRSSALTERTKHSKEWHSTRKQKQMRSCAWRQDNAQVRTTNQRLKAEPCVRVCVRTLRDDGCMCDDEQHRHNPSI